MTNLDNRYPILFFPIRIETKYSFFDRRRRKGKLRLRFFPDQISIDSFDPRLTNQEIEDARSYWNIVKDATQRATRFRRDSKEIQMLAWQQLVNKYNCQRAAYITKAVIKYDPLTDPDPKNPSFRSVDNIPFREEGEYKKAAWKLLPKKFIVYGKFNKESIPPLDLEVSSVNIGSSPDISIFPEKIDEEINPITQLRWISDFELARRNGLAVEIDLDEDQFHCGFKYILVYGVQDSFSPKKAKEEVENLFNSHHYTDGFSFLKQGTPTNLVKDQSEKKEEYTSIPAKSNSLDCHSQEFSGLPNSHKFKDIEGMLFEGVIPDGFIFERALGIENVSFGVPNGDNVDQSDALFMSKALWPVTIGYFLYNFISYSPSIQPDWRDKLKQHFTDYVKAQGVVPPFRISKIPYGILPITLVSEWLDPNMTPVDYILKTFVTSLKKRWLRFVSDFPSHLPRVMRTPEEVLKVHGKDFPNDINIARKQNLLDILSLEAISHNYYVRGIRSFEDVVESLGMQPVERKSRQNLYKEKIKREILSPTFDITDIPADTILEKLYDLIPGEGIANPENIIQVIRDGQGIRTRYAFPNVEFPPESEPYFLKPPELRNYLEYMYNHISDFLGPTKRGIRGHEFDNREPLLFRLLMYSLSFISTNTLSTSVNDFIKSIYFLKKYLNKTLPTTEGKNSDYKPDKLEALMFQTLDLGSYRLDAWLTSLANQRLHYLRKQNKTGLYIGALGWIENLFPQKTKMIKAECSDIEEKQTVNNRSNSIGRGGYIHAPTADHATAAAVLRNGYLTHSNNSDKKDLLRINLDSERTKNALELIRGIQNMPLSELLGYRLERRLHDAELDYLIDEFRIKFPIKKDDLEELANAVDPSKEKVEPRSLTDGLYVYNSWKKNDQTWISFLSDISKYGEVQEILSKIKPHMNYLLEVVDGLSDLCIAESVYQAVKGNYARSASILDGLGGDSKIPLPEIANFTRSGTSQKQRIFWADEVNSLKELDLSKSVDNIPWTNPRNIAEPNLNDMLESYIGGISFSFDIKDDKGNIINSIEPIMLDDIGLKVIDLLYLNEGELDKRLQYYAKSLGYKNFDIRYDKRYFDDLNFKSYAELKLLIESLKEMIPKAKPLNYFHLIFDEASIDNSLKIDILKQMRKEIFQRVHDLLLLYLQTIEELKKSYRPRRYIAKKREILMKASLFGLSLDVIPINRDGDLLYQDKELDELIQVAIKEFESRSKSFSNYLSLIPVWKKKWHQGNDNYFLEQISKDINNISAIAEKTSSTNEVERLKNDINLFTKIIKNILNNVNLLIIVPFPKPTNLLTDLWTSENLNKNAHKYIQKASYVRSNLKLFDDIITFSEIFELSDFSFYLNEKKFKQSAEILISDPEGIHNKDPLSIIVVVSNKIKGEESRPRVPTIVFGSTAKTNIAGIVVDEWDEKIPSPKQDTAIAFNFEGPSSQPPQSLLLAVSPNDSFVWSNDSIRDVILETMELYKIRAVDYYSIKELRQFLPTVVLNSKGEKVYINPPLYERS